MLSDCFDVNPFIQAILDCEDVVGVFGWPGYIERLYNIDRVDYVALLS